MFAANKLHVGRELRRRSPTLRVTKEISRKHAALRRCAQWHSNMYLFFSGVILNLRPTRQGMDSPNDYDASYRIFRRIL